MVILRWVLFLFAFSGIFQAVFGLVTEASESQKTAKTGNSNEYILVMSISGVVFLLIAIWMGSWKSYQCKAGSSKEIVFAGYVSAPGDTLPDNYPVILYLENNELIRSTTRFGELDVKKSGMDNGYFELRFPNSYELTRCDFELDIEQSSDRKKAFWWFQNTKYLYLLKTWGESLSAP